jgi:two-component system OmpR family response regulator
MRVLVVEDDPRMADLLRRGLTRLGMLVDVATTGGDALWMAPTTAYDVIVLDVGLPDVDGFEVAERLKELPDRPAVVLTSSRDASDYQPRLESSGARGFIAKDHLSGAALEEVLS